MTQVPQPAPQASPPKNRTRLLLVVTVVIVLVVVAGFLLYQNSLQPNIQVTTLNIGTPTQTPLSTLVLSEGRVSSSGSFTYTASLYGSYVMSFDNSFSSFSSKSVSVIFTVNSINQQSKSFTVPAGSIYTLTLTLSANDVLSGSFTVSGGSGNDVDFYIVANTCSEVVTFSFVLVNSGNSNGYTTVSFTSDSTSLWSNRYFVQISQQLPENGSVTLQDCLTHSFDIVRTTQSRG